MPGGQPAAVFKAYDIRGVVPDELDDDLARRVGAGFVEMLRADAAPGDPGPARVVVGHDMRPSSPGLARAFAEGVTGRGVDVVLIGLASTDELYFASGFLRVPGAMFTASHNPAQYNGIKLCRAEAAPVGEETGLREIRAIVERGGPEPSAGPPGRIEERDLLEAYARHLHGLVDLSGIRPLKVVVDAGNGMAGHTVPAVLGGSGGARPVTGLEVVPLYFELDGSFPNHEANPIEPANLVDLQAKVRAVGADVGLAFDGDADRCWVVDERGTSVSPSAVTALVASRELAREPGAAVIHNLITSRAVPELVREQGGRPVRSRVGHSFIKAEMARTGAIVGGEHSAHFYFRDFWRADSGMLAALHVLAALGRTPADETLSSLVARFSRYSASGEINTRVPDRAAQAATLERVRQAYASSEGVSLDDLDGLTVTHAGDPMWWFNLRPSNTEPVLRLNVEGADDAEMSRVRDEVLARLEGSS